MFDSADLLAAASAWLDATGPDSNFILSTRIRLARNLEPYPFVNRLDKKAAAEIQEKAVEALLTCPDLKDALTTDMQELEDLDRHLMVERHLVSPDFEKGTLKRSAVFRKDERLSVMVNEEDHLRLQAIVSGFDMETAWALLSRVDEELSGLLPYAFSQKYGYLTACPTNVGTGMRVSVLIHLPALVLTKDIDETLKGITQIGLSVRGFYGEGSEVLGNLFQISNHATLGKTEAEIIETIAKVVGQLVGFERRACETLLKEARVHIEDKIWRAFGILHNARLLTTNEFMSLSSALRLGVTLGILDQITLKSLNRLMIAIQPAHVQKRLNHKLEANERDFHRAVLVRENLIKPARRRSRSKEE